MNISLLMLLSFVLGGGGGDLLDYVSTSSYWQRDETPITFISMRDALAPVKTDRAAKLVSDLASADPQVREDAGQALIKIGPAAVPKLADASKGANAQAAELAKLLIGRAQAQSTIQSVRRLMAIRTLGELHDHAALELLGRVRNSKAPFEADYAATAIAMIQGKNLPHPRDPQAGDDVWLLPSNFRGVVQVCPRGEGPIDYARAIERLHLKPGQSAAKATATFSAIALSAAEQLGNVRLQAMTFGFSGDFGANSGYFAAIFTGEFDSGTVLKLASMSHVPFRTIAGIDVFEPDSESVVFMSGPSRIVLASSPARQGAIPLAQLIAAMAKSEPTLKQSPEMVKLIGEKRDDSPLWAAVQVRGSNQLADLLPSFDSLRLTSVHQDATLRLTLNSQLLPGADPAAAASLIDDAIKAAKSAALPLEEEIPALSELSGLLRSSHSTAQVDAVMTQARLNESIDALFMLPLLAKLGRPDEAVAPAPPEPDVATRPTSQPASN